MNQDTNNALALARELDTKAQALGCPLDRFSDALRQQHARIAELEAQLYAVGAGGVGASIQPPVQDDTAQAPVAWRVHPFDYGVGSDGVYALTMRTEQVEAWQRKEWKVEPLYAAPKPAPAQQEPVAWMYEWNGRTHITTTDQRPIEHAHPHFNKSKPLYTAPQPARQPLTDEQQYSVWSKLFGPKQDRLNKPYNSYVARESFDMVVAAIEAAHGITGSQQ